MDAGGFQWGWFDGYYGQQPADRQELRAGSLAVAALAVALRSAAERALNLLAAGFATGAGVAALTVVWERYVFTGLLNFSSDYRATGMFWEMHVGGAALDGYLALGVPFVAWAFMRAGDAARYSASALALLVSYACLATCAGLPCGPDFACARVPPPAVPRRARLVGASPSLRKGALAIAVAAFASYLVFRAGRCVRCWPCSGTGAIAAGLIGGARRNVDPVGNCGGWAACSRARRGGRVDDRQGTSMSSTRSRSRSPASWCGGVRPTGARGRSGDLGGLALGRLRRRRSRATLGLRFGAAGRCYRRRAAAHSARRAHSIERASLAAPPARARHRRRVGRRDRGVGGRHAGWGVHGRSFRDLGAGFRGRINIGAMGSPFFPPRPNGCWARAWAFPKRYFGAPDAGIPEATASRTTRATRSSSCRGRAIRSLSVSSSARAAYCRRLPDPYTLTFDARAPAPAQLHIEICQRQLLYSGACASSPRRGPRGIGNRMSSRSTAATWTAARGTRPAWPFSRTLSRHRASAWISTTLTLVGRVDAISSKTAISAGARRAGSR